MKRNKETVAEEKQIGHFIYELAEEDIKLAMYDLWK
jgi:hypothetical protein